MSIPVANEDAPFDLREGDTLYSLVLQEPSAIDGITSATLVMCDRWTEEPTDGFDGAPMTPGTATVNGQTVTTFTYAFAPDGPLPVGEYDCHAEFLSGGRQGSTQTFRVVVSPRED